MVLFSLITETPPSVLERVAVAWITIMFKKKVGGTQLIRSLDATFPHVNVINRMAAWLLIETLWLIVTTSIVTTCDWKSYMDSMCINSIHVCFAHNANWWEWKKKLVLISSVFFIVCHHSSIMSGVWKFYYVCSRVVSSAISVSAALIGDTFFNLVCSVYSTA